MAITILTPIMNKICGGHGYRHHQHGILNTGLQSSPTFTNLMVTPFTLSHSFNYLLTPIVHFRLSLLVVIVVTATAIMNRMVFVIWFVSCRSLASGSAPVIDCRFGTVVFRLQASGLGH